MAVCRGENGALWKELYTGVGTIPTMFIVFDPNTEIAGALLDDVLVVTYPGNPIPLRFGNTCRIAEGDEQSPVFGISAGMPVASDVRIRLLGRAPSFPFMFEVMKNELNFRLFSRNKMSSCSPSGDRKIPGSHKCALG
jgi:hypothetical protein